jgi:hypothetical protein
VQRFKEVFELVVRIVAVGTIVFGGICLLVHVVSTGEFFEDVSFGDGLVLSMLSTGFFVACALYWAGLTAVGLLLMRWPMQWLLRAMVNRVPHRALGSVPTDFRDMWLIPVWAFAALAVFVVWSLRLTPIILLQCLEIAVLQGFVGGLLLLMLRRHRFQNSGINITRDKSDTDVDHPALKRTAASFVAVWIIFPFILVPGQVSFVDLAFHAARLSKDHAIVHVREPWNTRLTLAGLPGKASFMGPNYVRFENVTIRRRSIGSRIIVEVTGAAGKPQFISFPRDHVEVE